MKSATEIWNEYVSIRGYKKPDGNLEDDAFSMMDVYARSTMIGILKIFAESMLRLIQSLENCWMPKTQRSIVNIWKCTWNTLRRLYHEKI